MPCTRACHGGRLGCRRGTRSRGHVIAGGAIRRRRFARDVEADQHFGDASGSAVVVAGLRASRLRGCETCRTRGPRAADRCSCSHARRARGGASAPRAAARCTRAIAACGCSRAGKTRRTSPRGSRSARPRRVTPATTISMKLYTNAKRVRSSGWKYSAPQTSMRSALWCIWWSVRNRKFDRCIVRCHAYTPSSSTRKRIERAPPCAEGSGVDQPKLSEMRLPDRRQQHREREPEDQEEGALDAPARDGRERAPGSQALRAWRTRRT